MNPGSSALTYATLGALMQGTTSVGLGNAYNGVVAEEGVAAAMPQNQQYLSGIHNISDRSKFLMKIYDVHDKQRERHATKENGATISHLIWRNRGHSVDEGQLARNECCTTDNYTFQLHKWAANSNTTPLPAQPFIL